jgi:hypothetical protein
MTSLNCIEMVSQSDEIAITPIQLRCGCVRGTHHSSLSSSYYIRMLNIPFECCLLKCNDQQHNSPLYYQTMQHSVVVINNKSTKYHIISIDGYTTKSLYACVMISNQMLFLIIIAKSDQ